MLKNAIRGGLRRLGYDLVPIGPAIAPAVPAAPVEPIAVPASTEPRGLYRPVFDFDGLRTDPRVIHNHDFMREPAYVRAFEAGESALGHDHKMYWRLHVALWCAARAARLAGDFVECGVWRGFLSTAIMNYLPWPTMSKRFYLFDTFDGLDERYLTSAESANRDKLNHLRPYYRDNWSFVERHFADYRGTVLVKGSVPDTLSIHAIERVCFLSLDMNCAIPELRAIEHFWDRLVPSAPVLLDDYGFVSYEEQKRSMDEFAASRGVAILALPTGQGLLLKY